MARSVFILFLKFYQKFISPFLPAHCRFHPTCSEYARQALDRHGFFKGIFYAVRRVGKCNPFHPGGFDPVP